MADRPDDLLDVSTNTLVLETGRRLELAVRKLVPDAVDAQGKPLTLGPRMRELRERLGPEAWQAFQAWSRERNAYTHAEISELADAEAFRQNFLLVEARLKKLQKPPSKRKASTRKRGAPAQPGKGANYLLAAVILGGLVVGYYSC